MVQFSNLSLLQLYLKVQQGKMSTGSFTTISKVQIHMITKVLGEGHL